MSIYIKLNLSIIKKMSFKDNLKRELDYQDIQLKELAAKTGISKNTLGNYLTGHNSLPNVDSAVKIAKALGVSVEYLVSGTSSKTEEKKLQPNIKKITEKLQKLSEDDLYIIESLISILTNKHISNR